METHPGVIDYMIGIDPGKTTGWARYVDLTPGGDHDTSNFDSGQEELLSILNWVYSILLLGARPRLVCEDFIITPETAKKSRQTEPLDGIGALKWMASYFDTDLKMQTPASAKKFATDDKLKHIGWYYPTKGGHANDAARHLLVRRVELKRINPLDLI